MKIGFIGVGNMGGTLAKLAVGAEKLVSSRTVDKAQEFARKNGCVALSNKGLAAQAEMIFLGVKPQKMAGLLEEIAPVLALRKDRFVLVSMAAGLTIDRIKAMVGFSCPVLRIMPNTPCAVGEGMIQYCANEDAKVDRRTLCEILAPAGQLAEIPENLMDAASAVSGCGPAYVYLFIEALADAGVACGLPRADAQTYAAQTLVGAARMVLESGQHPGALKDAVCSPAGSTIRGVHALEAGAFRATVENAVFAACERNRALGK